MKRINFPQLIRESERLGTMSPEKVRRMYGDFQKRLSGEVRPVEKKRNWALMAGLGFSGVLLSTLVVVLVSPRSPQSGGQTVTVTEKVIPTKDLKAGTGFVFEAQAVCSPAENSQILFEAKTRATLEILKEGKSSWTLKEGTVTVQNQNPSVKNRFQAGVYVFDEIGTAYVLSADDKWASLQVKEGLVLVSNTHNAQQTRVAAGKSWKEEIAVPARPEVKKTDDQALALLVAARKNADFFWQGSAGLHLITGGVYKNLDLKTAVPAVTFKMDLPSGLRAVRFSDHSLAVATHSEFLYFFSPNGERTSVKAGNQTAENIFWQNERLVFVNAAGEVQIYEKTGRNEAKQKVLNGSLWEGCLYQNRYLCLPDTQARIVIFDLDLNRVVKEAPLPEPASGQILERQGKLEVPQSNGKVSLELADLI